MRINIGIIRIHVITNLGSLNVGKTILCNNRSAVTVQPGPAASGEAPPGPERRDGRNRPLDPA
jgi:hypothetical protein